MRILSVLIAFGLGACASTVERSTPADAFFQRMSANCGKAFVGKLIAGNESDASFASAELRANFDKCDDREMQIAFDVGEDRSRTWIVTRTDTGLRLKHRHMLKDDTEDPVSQYGGDTVTVGTYSRQQFTADEFSKAMFTKEGRAVSNANVWAFEVAPGQSLVYELKRPDRLFRVEFDLRKPLVEGKR